MEPVKLLALDLDGTLLNAQKELTPRTRDALYAAACRRRGCGVWRSEEGHDDGCRFERQE